ncbi:MAG: type II toxin-antitoxin system VapC family toxin [Syntrophomonadaceae bacterium]|jgi:predicted nucleic acid-binding protein|nr:type II toxin-antitoxin system VapC family toxin [Syntrophomonadaceae bacterium]
MNIVDSSGWLEYFGKGVNGKRFAPVIQETANLVAPTITIYEVFKRLLQQRGEDDALSAIGWMAMGQVVALSQELALEAAALSVEHRLPMADSIILATAQAHQATLWTLDEHFKGLPGVEYIPRK